MTKKNINRVLIPLLIIVATLTLVIMVNAAATGTHTPVTGVTVAVSGATYNSMSGGAVTVTAKGSAGVFGFGASAKTATITVTNDSGSAAKISFDWTARSVNQLVIDGVTYTGASGSFSKLLNSQEKFTITITTAKNNTTNELVMSNFVCTEAALSSNVTFQFDSSLGSITVAGVSVANGASQELSIDGATLVATPKSGVTFLGWIDGDNKIIDRASSFDMKPAGNMTVKAVFTKDTPYFWVNNDYLYEGLGNAVTIAQGVSYKTVVLANNSTLTKSNYTIPSGVTLLIPFDAAGTLYTDKPGIDDSYSKPKDFRTLTMADGAKITVHGAISLSSKVNTKQGSNGCPSDYVGRITMQSGSEIVVENGGNLYAWGFITGSGSVTANSGSNVYECFQVSDWRGGTAASSMILKNKTVFPVSQYYVQNIEVPLTIKAGATEKTHYAFDMGTLGGGVQADLVGFVGKDGCMFPIISGELTKDYDESTDRMVIDIRGEIAVSKFSMKVSVYTLDTSKYVLPLNGNITVNIVSGSATLKQDLAMLPGAEINISKGAELVIDSDYQLIVYDLDQWDVYCYSNAKYRVVKYAPGGKYTRTEADLVDAKVLIDGTLDASKGYIYVTKGGANIYSLGSGVLKTIKGSQTTTSQVTQSGTSVTYVEDIPIIPAKLKNANGEYVATGTYLAIKSPLDFKYTNDEGIWYNYDIQYQDVDKTADNIKHEYLLHGESLTFFNNFVGCHTIPDSELAVADATYYYHKETKSCTVDGEGTTAICDDCGAKLTVEFSTVSTDTTTSNVYKVSGGYFSGNYYVVVSSGPAKYLIETVTANSNDCSFTFDALENIKGLNVEFYNDDFANDLIRLRGYQKNDDGTIRFIGTIDTTGFDMENIATGWPSHNLYGGIKITMTVNGNKLDGIQDVVYTYLYNSEGSFYQFVDSYVFSFSANFGNNTSATIELEFIDKAETPSVVGGTKTTVNVSLAGGEVVITRVENAN